MTKSPWGMAADAEREKSCSHTRHGPELDRRKASTGPIFGAKPKTIVQAMYECLDCGERFWKQLG
jgi:hypothetical protein